MGSKIKNNNSISYNVSLPITLFERMDELCDIWGIVYSEFIRMAVYDFIMHPVKNLYYPIELRHEKRRHLTGGASDRLKPILDMYFAKYGNCDFIRSVIFNYCNKFPDYDNIVSLIEYRFENDEFELLDGYIRKYLQSLPFGSYVTSKTMLAAINNHFKSKYTWPLVSQIVHRIMDQFKWEKFSRTAYRKVCE